ncbi:MAG: hypothetical protein HY765_08895, partial [Rhodomicrobium sp.]|nr:hypothetical protein [Rhodomicrobium sp.]
LLTGFESLAEVRLLGRQSFGAGMPGAITLSAPETAHWLQEQELEFGLTITIADEANLGFAKDAIEEADEILFVARGGHPELSALEQHAMSSRGGRNCRLLLPESGGHARNAASWLSDRPYRTVQTVDFASPEAIRLTCSGLLGEDNSIAAASCGVYAAAILGALQAFEDHGMPPVSLAAAGSAVLPAGLLACGADFSRVEEIFRELASPLLWKRAPRAEAGLYDPAALDKFLVSALQGLAITPASRPFAAISFSVSEDRAELHPEGRLHGAVRAGIAPPGILPPLILDSGAILVSGENESEALFTAARALTPSPIVFLYPKAPPIGNSAMSYRELSGALPFRLTPFPSPKAIDRRVRLETVLAAAGGRLKCDTVDWPEWTVLRDAAYEWTIKELESRKNGG